VRKIAQLLLFASLLGSACSAAMAQSSAPPGSTVGPLSKPGASSEARCSSNDPTTVVVCGRSKQQYRIDPLVLEATREAEAFPVKPKLDATTAQACTGPNCGGGMIPLVGMALTAVKAAVLASQGDDWREAFRTHPDEYRAYEDAKARTSRISIGVTVANTRP
jgi:hypothetical protein